jgi:hypothetical protein
MTTAIAEPKTDTETVVFVSRSPNQVLTRRPVRDMPDGFGGKVRLTEDEFLARERDANAQRTARGEDPVEIDEAPWKAEFVDYRYQTSDPTMIAFLRAHKNFGATQAPGGFYEEGPSPEDPAVAVSALMGRIVKAQALPKLEDSVATLHEILEEEKAGLNRPAIVEVVETAIEAKLEPSEPGADADSTKESTSTSQPSQPA